MINETLELERQGNFAGAVEFLSNAINVAKSDSTQLPRGAYPLLARLFVRTTRFADAEKACRAGLEISPKDFDLLNMLGIALRRLGRADEALKALDQAQRLNPKHLAPLVNKDLARRIRPASQKFSAASIMRRDLTALCRIAAFHDAQVGFSLVREFYVDFPEGFS